jgi:dolichol-phosphate mannosyltransferase
MDINTGPRRRRIARTTVRTPAMNDALVIVPTYNERENLPRLVPAVLAAAPVDVLVVDDGSPDGTGQVADTLAAADARVHVLHRTAKEGLGRAYVAGFRHALALEGGRYGRFVQMDADFSHDPAALPRLLEPARDGGEADVVIGSRYVPGGGVSGWPWYRHVLSRGGSLYARGVLGIGVRDLTGGYKCWRRAALAAIRFDDVAASGYGFQIEMTWRARRAGQRVVEVPIHFPDRQVGRSKMSPRIMTEALALVWRLRLGRK